MKKITFAFILFILPIFVFADTCSVKVDTQTNNDRELTCDLIDGEQTLTTYETSSSKTVLDNDVCTVKCTESLVFSIDPMKKVLAGTSFNYPLYVSGERKCTATYDYVSYETTIKALVTEYEALSGVAKTTKGNEIVNYYDQKKSCDEFVVKDSDYQNVYKLGGDVSLKVQTSTSTDTLNYKYRDISDYYSTSNIDDVKYTACGFNEATKTCDGATRTISSWNETAKIFGKYTMPNVFVEKYTGEVKSSKTSTTCNAGDRYFVSFNELTNPVTGSTDKGYKLTLTANNLGNNLVLAESNTWKLNVNCFYQVKNLAFPQGGETVASSDTDENYTPFGNVAFEYRTIDLSDPFPEREPGANWYGKQSLITPTIETDPDFEINLSRKAIIDIREYNKTNPYVTFNLNDQDKSYFVENNVTIIDRK